MVTANSGADLMLSKYSITVADINITTNTFYLEKQQMYFYGEGSDISIYFSKITPSCALFLSPHECCSRDGIMIQQSRRGGATCAM